MKINRLDQEALKLKQKKEEPIIAKLVDQALNLKQGKEREIFIDFEQASNGANEGSHTVIEHETLTFCKIKEGQETNYYITNLTLVTGKCWILTSNTQLLKICRTRTELTEALQELEGEFKNEE